MTIGGGTRLLAVLGWPVDHSLSPAIHNAALAADGRDLVYVALPVAPDDLAHVVSALHAVGVAGINVTVPHKKAVVDACQSITDEARLIGAVNTLVRDDDGWQGDNTDAVGLQRALAPLVDTPRRAVLLGTGGAARAGVVALARLGCEVAVVGRRPDAAAEVADVVPPAIGHAHPVDLADGEVVADVVAAADVVVNATSLGMGGEHLPTPFHALRTGQLAYDMVYADAPTPFLRDAEAAGATAADGLDMLVAQAAISYERWFRQLPDEATMHRAARTALR